MEGIRVDRDGVRRFDREFRVKVLEFLLKNPDKNEACRKFYISKRELARIIVWKRHTDFHARTQRKLPSKEVTLRGRLYEKAVQSVDKSFDEIDEVVAANPILQQKNGIEFLPTVVNHLKNRAQNAIKLLEGTGDLRRAGDDLPNQGARVPMFTLPAGSSVAVTITTGENHAQARVIGSGSTRKALEAGDEAVDATLQVRQSSGG